MFLGLVDFTREPSPNKIWNKGNPFDGEFTLKGNLPQKKQEVETSCLLVG